MEAVTAFLWGPLCPAVVYGIATSAPWRYTLMAAVSLGQMYGDALYYGTCYLEGFVHSRPEALYFWGYFVGLNALWVVIPGAVLAYAAAQISAAVGAGGSKVRCCGCMHAEARTVRDAGPCTERGCERCWCGVQAKKNR
jgi:cholestenol delta-isomerase